MVYKVHLIFWTSNSAMSVHFFINTYIFIILANIIYEWIITLKDIFRFKVLVTLYLYLFRRFYELNFYPRFLTNANRNDALYYQSKIKIIVKIHL